MHRLFWFLSLLLIFLSGCQMAPSPQEAPRDPATLTHWQAQGRFAYKTPEDGGSATVRWQQHDQQGELRFSGPMGFGSAELQWSPHHATLITNKGEFSAPNAEALAFELTGLPLPAEALVYWLRGLPWPHAPAQKHQGEPHPHGLEQLGWSVEYDRWKQVQGYWLPHRLKAKHAHNTFTLVIQQWIPAP